MHGRKHRQSPIEKKGWGIWDSVGYWQHEEERTSVSYETRKRWKELGYFKAKKWRDNTPYVRFLQSNPLHLALSVCSTRQFRKGHWKHATFEAQSVPSALWALLGIENTAEARESALPRHGIDDYQELESEAWIKYIRMTQGKEIPAGTNKILGKLSEIERIPYYVKSVQYHFQAARRGGQCRYQKADWISFNKIKIPGDNTQYSADDDVLTREERYEAFLYLVSPDYPNRFKTEKSNRHLFCWTHLWRYLATVPRNIDPEVRKVLLEESFQKVSKQRKVRKLGWLESIPGAKKRLEENKKDWRLIGLVVRDPHYVYLVGKDEWYEVQDFFFQRGQRYETRKEVLNRRRWNWYFKHMISYANRNKYLTLWGWKYELDGYCDYWENPVERDTWLVYSHEWLKSQRNFPKN